MQTDGRDTLSKSKVKLSHNTMAVLCKQPAHHDEVLQWFHNIEVLAVERHSRGKMKVRSYSIYVLETKPYFFDTSFNRESRVILKLDGIVSFITKGIEASDERKTKS